MYNNIEAWLASVSDLDDDEPCLTPEHTSERASHPFSTSRCPSVKSFAPRESPVMVSQLAQDSFIGIAKTGASGVPKYLGHEQSTDSTSPPNQSLSPSDLKCSVCDKTFITRNKLHKHKRQQHERKHQCPACPWKFGLMGDLRRHQRSVHPDFASTRLPELHISCPECHRRFKRRDHLIRHLKSVHKLTTMQDNERFMKDRKDAYHDVSTPSVPRREEEFTHRVIELRSSDQRLQPDSSPVPQSHEDLPQSTSNGRYSGLVLPPDSPPISQEQLATEVKGIYARLVMVETKCINIDTAQSASTDTALNAEQWKTLIALHRTLLFEHHDFLMATQHASATASLRQLTTKYDMPARMWKHGIHAFLEVLSHRLPQSQDYMMAFIHLTYQMMSLLLETVPRFSETWITYLGDLARYRMATEEDTEARDIWVEIAARWDTEASDRQPAIHRMGIEEDTEVVFEDVSSFTDTWIECLGDLERYRMAIEEEKEARDTWGGVAARWYNMASGQRPAFGRLYHHLGILERPNLQKFYSYAKYPAVIRHYPLDAWTEAILQEPTFSNIAIQLELLSTIPGHPRCRVNGLDPKTGTRVREPP